MSDSLLTDKGSAGLSSLGTHGRLSDKGTVNSGRDSCAPLALVLLDEIAVGVIFVAVPAFGCVLFSPHAAKF